MVNVNTLPLPIDVVIWYATSVVCTSGSKQILNAGLLPSSRWLTMTQLIIAAIVGWALLATGLVREASTPTKAGAASAKPDSGGGGGGDGHDGARWALAATFVVGFGTLNAAMGLIPASLAMTLRAAEPLFSVALVAALMGAGERASPRLCLTLVPIVGGCAMSSFGSAQFKAAGLALVCVANTAFPLRTIIYKRLRAATGAGNFTLFADCCWRAAAIVAVGNLALDAASAAPRYAWARAALASPSTLGQLLLNGCCYFAYLQWSFIVLSKVSVVSHAVANAMRRPVNIAFAIFFFATAVSWLNAAGIALACAGTLWYSRVKAEERVLRGAKASRSPPPGAASPQQGGASKGGGGGAQRR